MKAQDLKNSILQMAMEGKLVPQDPNDEPASVLLERIKKEKEQLIKEKKIKRNNKESFILRKNSHFYEKVGKKGEEVCIDDEIPFDIPDSWEWARLDNIGVYKKGPFGSALTKSMFVPKSDDSIKVYEQKNAIQKNDKLGDYYITKEYYESKMKGFTVESGDIIVSCAGTIGETYVLPDNIELGIINQALMRMNIVKSLNLDFFLIYFDYILKKSAIEHSKGSAIKNIPPFKIFKRLLVPLPPLNEQKRIVGEIKEIYPLIEKYDGLKEKLDYLNNNFPYKIKDSILQEAIQGNLVPQDPNDEPASVLLERIKKEKEQLIKAKKIKRNKNESFIFKENNHFYEKIGKNDPICIDDEIPFDIPDSWEWCRLNSFTQIVMGQSPKGEFVKESDEGMEFHQGKIFFGEKFLEKSDKTTTKPSKISSPDSILLCVRAPVGKINLCDREICIGRGLASLKPYTDESLDYLYYALLNYEEKFTKKATGSTFKAITKTVVENELIPIPPLKEQKAIVDRIEELFSSVNKMNY